MTTESKANRSVMDLQSVKGTREFYPPEMRLRNWLFDIWRDVSRSFGFEEYDACVLESEELYIRKAGDEITGQLYNFEDKGGRRIALRPEMTPSLARLVLQRKNSLNFPLKWFSIPQCFRYERMTRGRKREHFQWNLDLVGQEGVVAEAEMISALVMSLEKMGLNPDLVELKINDRRILNALLQTLGVPKEAHLPLMVIIDKRDKVSPEVLREMLAEGGMNAEQIDGLEAFFKSADSGLEATEKLLGESSGATSQLKELLGLLEKMGMGPWVTFDCTVVRGLSYYTGTVFELCDRAGKLRAIAGGGRYDSLLSAYGGESIPAVGFGFGDVVILELLGDLGLLPELKNQVDVSIIPFSTEEFPAALEIGHALRKSGFKVENDFGGKKLKKALNRADESGASHAVLLMPEEIKKGVIILRNMALRSETQIPLKNLLNNPSEALGIT